MPDVEAVKDWDGVLLIEDEGEVDSDAEMLDVAVLDAESDPEIVIVPEVDVDGFADDERVTDEDGV